ncbi:MAG: hypothetical protein ACRBCI_01450 [Cellvibrionaceae bacterium]
MRIVVFLMVSLLSVGVNAHSGHGAENIVAHAIEHSIWYVSGFAILLCLILKITQNR